MRLLSFKASKVHGFLDFDISFFRKLTFLTGINGCGKTTAINCIAALISPDLAILVGLEYDSLELHFELGTVEHWIRATKVDGGIEISTSAAKSGLMIPAYIPDLEQPIHVQSSAENTYYRELTSSFASHPALHFLLSLQTPMFLGLDRRSRNEEEYVRRFAQSRTVRPVKNIFGNSLSGSLRAAAKLAEDNRKSSLIAAGRVAEELQRAILLGLLQVDVSGADVFGNLTAPTLRDVAEIESLKKLLNTLPQVLNISKEDVAERVAPLFDRLQEFISVIPSGKTVEELLGGPGDSKVLTALLGWTANQTHLKRIKNIQAIVTSYNKKRAKYLDTSKTYLLLINKFMKESFKAIEFDNNGNLSVAIEGITGPPKDISSLSSGEAQIFVIITQLSFNRLSASDNVFIIDEPEVSLHVDWQEIFVESIQAANPDVQFILASHSPSIILDKIENCIDLNPRRQGVNKTR